MAETMHEERLCDVKWGTLAFLGILSLIFGIILLFYPGITAAVVIVLFGIIILVLAFLALVLALMSTGGRATLLLLGAIVGFIVGIIAILAPIVIGALLVIIIGIVLFMIGIVDIAIALGEKAYPHRWLLFILWILSIIVAFLFWVYPAAGAVALFGIIVGIYFVIYGILALIAGFALRSVKKQYCMA
jgi:uncharacterized membrane protein HdeD (DUF308 family)